MTKAAMKDTAPDPVLEMVLRLPGLWKYSSKLKSMAWKLAKDSAEHRALGPTGKATWTEVWALQDHILATPCTLLAGAAVHIMLTNTLNDLSDNSTGYKGIYPQIDRAMRSGVPVVADAAGLDMKEVSTGHYAADYTELFPTVAIVVD